MIQEPVVLSAGQSWIREIVGALAILIPLLTGQYLAWKKQRDEMRQNKEEAIADKEVKQREIIEGQQGIHTLVNNQSTEQKNEIKALKLELNRVLREGTPTPTGQAGDAAPGEVTQDHGVLTTQRESPFPSPPEKT